MARVLIVDDTDIVRKAVELAVLKMGHQPESTCDALVALGLAVANPPALALVDYRMPGMDGLQLLGALHEALGQRCPRVVFVTATPPEQVRARTPAHLSADAYVKKPFQLDELERTVRRVLGEDRP